MLSQQLKHALPPSPPKAGATDGAGAPSSASPPPSAFHEAYEVSRVLQKALFGEVVLARHKKFGTDRAVKVLRRDLLARTPPEGFFESPDQEMKVMQHLRERPHPNLISSEEIFRTEGEILVVMPYVSGGELFGVVEKSVLNEDDCFGIFRQLLDGVKHLHDLGFAHNDISLENVLMDDDGNPVLCDYGLSQEIGAVWDSGRSRVGKPGYVAPEIYHGLQTHCSGKADVFSLGVVLFIMLFGAPPFVTPSDQDRRYAYIQKGKLRQILQLWGCLDCVSPSTIDLLQCMLAGDPDERPTLSDLLEELSEDLEDDDEDEMRDVFDASSCGMGIPMRTPTRGSGSSNSSSRTSDPMAMELGTSPTSVSDMEYYFTAFTK